MSAMEPCRDEVFVEVTSRPQRFWRIKDVILRRVDADGFDHSSLLVDTCETLPPYRTDPTAGRLQLLPLDFFADPKQGTWLSLGCYPGV